MSMGLKFLIFSLVIMTGHCRPHHADLEPTDVCLFTCDFCFTGETLLKCANECIVLEGSVGPMWRKTCPYFGQRPTF